MSENSERETARLRQELADCRLMLLAVVAAAGGRILVRSQDMQGLTQWSSITRTDDIATGGIWLEVSA